jgi:peptide/nickel transport system substrate-binding protein
MIARRLATVFFVALAGAFAASGASAQENILRVGMSMADVTNLDPDRASATADVTLVSWMFNGLVRFPPGSANPSEIQPDLAESWTTSPDGLEWTFKLRKGVKFHGDWGEMTAEDVVYSLERAADPNRSTFAASYAGLKAKATDDSTVVVTLSHQTPGFLGLISNYHGGNIISKKAAEKLGADFNNHPVGTGPFAFGQRVTQQYVQLVAHPGYFRGMPKLTGIKLQFIPSDSSRELAFRSGELDLIDGKREQRWIDTMRTIEGSTVDIFNPGEFRTLHLNQTVKPLDDVRIRQAIAYAVNVDDIVRFVGKDVAEKGCSVVPNGYLGEDCSVWPYKFDPDKAKSLLAEAGLKNGFTVKAVVSNNTAQQPIMEVIQAQLADVGIKMDMAVVDHPTYQEQVRKDLSAIVFYGAARFPVANAYLEEFYASSGIPGKKGTNTNFSHCMVADADIEAANKAPAGDQQNKLWSDAQRKIEDTVCSVPLFTLKQVWLRSNKLSYGYDLKGSLNLAPPITEATTVTR